MKRKSHQRNIAAGKTVRLLELLWNNAGDLMPGQGGADTFVGPNKIIRHGVMEINYNVGDPEEYEGIEYTAVITLGDLVPKEHRPELANTVKRKSKAA